MSATQPTPGKGGKGLPEGFNIVQTHYGDGTTAYEVCGKCGARLLTGKMEQAARDGMAAAIEERILDPLCLLAGLMSNINEEADDEPTIKTTGILLGLVLRGARKELEIQQVGGQGAYIVSKWLEEAEKGKGA